MGMILYLFISITPIFNSYSPLYYIFRILWGYLLISTFQILSHTPQKQKRFLAYSFFFLGLIADCFMYFTLQKKYYTQFVVKTTYFYLVFALLVFLTIILSVIEIHNLFQTFKTRSRVRDEIFSAFKFSPNLINNASLSVHFKRITQKWKYSLNRLGSKKTTEQKKKY